MDMVADLGASRVYRAAGESAHQQPQRWFNTADITVAHQSNLLKQLNQQRRQELFCDCSVLVEGQLFRAHRNVLYASSGYFRMLLSQGTENVNATFDVFSPETFTIILDFIYSGQLELSSQNVIEVMSAASYLQMNTVINYCKNFIKSSLDISAKDEDSDRGLSLSETCSFASGVGEESTDLPQPGPGSVSPPPALWTRDNSRSQSSFAGKEDGELTAAVLKTEAESPSHEISGDLDEMQDPHDPPYTLPGSERRRTRAGTKRRASQSARTQGRNDQEAKAQKAEKADELYATLPSIVGVVGNYCKDSNSIMRFKCPFCTHTVKRKADLKRHLRCHTGERPYPCQECSKRFTRLEHLRSHFETIHQARKLVCRKCKCHVTEETGHVVCEGTRRYRMCATCIQEVGCEDISLEGLVEPSEEPALFLGVDGEEEGDGKRDWMTNDDDDDELAEDSGADLIIQQVDDSDEELQ